MKTLSDLMSKVEIDGGGCWIWTGALKNCKRGTHRYGWVAFNGTQMSAHRAAWMLFNGQIPNAYVICHKCDVPACVNPDHLFIGSQEDNVRDMILKGRKHTGVAIRRSDGKPVRAVLTESQIVDIKKQYLFGLSQARIAVIHGVSQGCISQLLRGVTQYAK